MALRELRVAGMQAKWELVLELHDLRVAAMHTLWQPRVGGMQA